MCWIPFVRLHMLACEFPSRGSFRPLHVGTLALPPTPTRSLRFVRMGFAYANEHIIQYMNNVKAPYNVNRLTQEVAVRALEDRSLYKDRVTTILDVSSVRFLDAGRELKPLT